MSFLELFQQLLELGESFLHGPFLGSLDEVDHKEGSFLARVHFVYEVRDGYLAYGTATFKSSTWFT